MCYIPTAVCYLYFTNQCYLYTTVHRKQEILTDNRQLDKNFQYKFHHHGVCMVPSLCVCFLRSSRTLPDASAGRLLSGRRAIARWAKDEELVTSLGDIMTKYWPKHTCHTQYSSTANVTALFNGESKVYKLKKWLVTNVKLQKWMNRKKKSALKHTTIKCCYFLWLTSEKTNLINAKRSCVPVLLIYLLPIDKQTKCKTILHVQSVPIKNPYKKNPHLRNCNKFLK